MNLARVGDFDRPQHVFNARIVRTAMKVAAQPAARAALGIDPTAASRAQAAFDVVWSRHEVGIAEVMKDRSLTADQRAAAVRALRERQGIEANAARKQIMDEEKAAAKERRRMQSRPKPPPL